MAGKSKAPEYQAQEPAFLRQLRQQYGGNDGRQTHASMPRPKRLDKDDEDDGPTYVLESDNTTLTKNQYAKLVEDGKKDIEPPATVVPVVSSAAPKSASSKSAAIGSRKRKAGKVVVGADDNDDDEKYNKIERTEGKSLVNQDSVARAPKKEKKQKREVALTFDDND